MSTEYAQTKKEIAIADVKQEISNIKKIRLFVILIGIVLFVLAVLCVGYIENEFLSETLFMLLGLASIVTFIFAGTSVSAIRECKDKLKLIEFDVDAYLMQQDAENKARNDRYRQEIDIAHPRCPRCGRTDTRRIGNINRATSVAFWGLASSKIGKQYECYNCKHKW